MSVDRFHSLSKKQQPTTASQPSTSTKQHPPPSLLCPETAEFFPNKHASPPYSELYIHNLHIDYGRLQQPVYFREGDKHQKVVKFSQEERGNSVDGEDKVEMVTKRVTGISLWSNS